MTRSKWAVLGLSTLALLAMSVFLAPGAQGNNQNPEFTCLENQTTHVGCTATGVNIPIHRQHDGGFSSVHTFSAGSATLRCNTAIFHITTDNNGTNSAPVAQPTYENCFANPGHLQVHINTNGCELQFFPDHTSGETTGEDEYTGTASIVNCGATKSITITITNNTFTEPTNESGAQKCLIHIPEQTGIGPIYFRTDTSANPTDMEVEAKTAKATAKFTGGFFNCGVFGETANVFFTGNTTFQAKNHDGEPTDLELD